MATTRALFVVQWQQSGKDKLGWIHCLPSVAKFLGIDTLGEATAKAISAGLIDVKGYTRKYYDADGQAKDVTVEDYVKAFGNRYRIGGKKIIFQTGETRGKSKRVLNLRASPGMSNLGIIDALGGIIPEGKVAYGKPPGTSEVSASFRIDASTYVLMPKAKADATANILVVTVDETIITLMRKQKTDPKPNP